MNSQQATDQFRVSKLFSNPSSISSAPSPGMQPSKTFHFPSLAVTQAKTGRVQTTHCSAHDALYPWPDCPPAEPHPCGTSTRCSSCLPPCARSPSAPCLQSEAGTSQPGCLQWAQVRVISWNFTWFHTCFDHHNSHLCFLYKTGNVMSLKLTFGRQDFIPPVLSPYKKSSQLNNSMLYEHYSSQLTCNM